MYSIMTIIVTIFMRKRRMQSNNSAAILFQMGAILNTTDPEIERTYSFLLPTKIRNQSIAYDLQWDWALEQVVVSLWEWE